MKIGSTKVNGKIFLAPMADVTNLAFRMLCKKHGAALTYSEMISADAILHDNTRTDYLGLSCNEEKPFGIQLFGNSADTIAKASSIIEEKYAPDIIDINFGCPSNVLVKYGYGSALLNSPEKIREVVSNVCRKVDTPVTVKMRVLPDIKKTLNIASIVEDAGASAITVHGRTQAQQYSGKADHEYTRNIKDELSIPVIANGDIVDGLSAKYVIDYTGCDALMIGRAAMGNPYIFSEISHFLHTGKQIRPDCTQRFEDFTEYVRLLKKYDIVKYVDLRMHAKWFTRGVRDGRHVRHAISSAKDTETIIRIMEKLFVKSY